MPENDHIRLLLARMRLDGLLRHFPPRLVRALYVFVNGFVTIGTLGSLAWATGSPFVFPSLGRRTCFSSPRVRWRPALATPSWDMRSD